MTARTLIKLGPTARKPVFVVCEQHMRRPAYTPAQSDQNLCYSLIGNIMSRLVTDKISVPI